MKPLAFSAWFAFACLPLLPPVADAELAPGIPPNHPYIAFDGVCFPKKSAEQVEFHRFNEEVLRSPEKYFSNKKAAATTGVIVRFTTAAPTVTASFEFLPDIFRGAWFGVYQNGTWYKDFRFSKKERVKKVRLAMESAAPGQPVTYEIVLPNWANPAFTGLELAGDLLPNPSLERKHYVALGDSITHGTGQNSSFTTYPFLLARKAGWTLANLAVGGGKVSPAVGTMLQGRQVDLVTILIGYNDHKLRNPQKYEADYRTLLGYLRHDHAHAEIFCITPTFSTSTQTDPSLDDYRGIVSRIVDDLRAGGDKRLHLVRGEKLTTAADLGDKVHLNTKGAARFADRLCDELKACVPALFAEP